MSQDVLTLDYSGSSDYTLAPEVYSVWVTVGGFSLYILRQQNGGVSVEGFRSGKEAGPADASFVLLEV